MKNFIKQKYNTKINHHVRAIKNCFAGRGPRVADPWSMLLMVYALWIIYGFATLISLLLFDSTITERLIINKYYSLVCYLNHLSILCLNHDS